MDQARPETLDCVIRSQKRRDQVAEDVTDMPLEDRLRKCKAEFERNVGQFKELAAIVGRVLLARDRKRDLDQVLLADSRERLEKSRLVLELTERLPARRERKAPAVARFVPDMEGVMDRSMILRHLAQTEEHIRLGARTIARQEQIISELEAHGHDSLQARRMLASFEQAQAIALAERDLVKQEFAHSKK